MREQTPAAREFRNRTEHAHQVILIVTIAVGNGPTPTPDFTALTRPSTLLLRAAMVAPGAISASHFEMRC